MASITEVGGRATFGWVSVARDRRREQAKLQPTAALRFRAERSSEGLEKIRRPSVASSTAANVATSAPKVIMMDEFEMRDEVKPAPASRLRAEGLWAGEAQVEAGRDEVTLPAEELRKATTLLQEFLATYAGITSKEEAWSEITSTDL